MKVPKLPDPRLKRHRPRTRGRTHSCPSPRLQSPAGLIRSLQVQVVNVCASPLSDCSDTGSDLGLTFLFTCRRVPLQERLRCSVSVFSSTGRNGWKVYMSQHTQVMQDRHSVRNSGDVSLFFQRGLLSDTQLGHAGENLGCSYFSSIAIQRRRRVPVYSLDSGSVQSAPVQGHQSSLCIPDCVAAQATPRSLTPSCHASHSASIFSIAAFL